MSEVRTEAGKKMTSAQFAREGLVQRLVHIADAICSATLAAERQKVLLRI